MFRLIIRSRAARHKAVYRARGDVLDNAPALLATWRLAELFNYFEALRTGAITIHIEGSIWGAHGEARIQGQHRRWIIATKGSSRVWIALPRDLLDACPPSPLRAGTGRVETSWHAAVEIQTGLGRPICTGLPQAHESSRFRRLRPGCQSSQWPSTGSLCLRLGVRLSIGL
jgi:hypothetical protein